MENEYLSQKESEKIINNIIKEGDIAKIQAVMEAVLYGNSNLRYKKNEKDEKEYQLNQNLSQSYKEIKFRAFSEQFLTKNIVDLELLKEVVSIQNGLSSNLIKDDEMKKYIMGDYTILKDSESDRINFLKQLKFLEQEGIIDEENTPLITVLREKSEYDKIILTEEENHKYSLKKIINNRFENTGVLEEQKIEQDEKYFNENRAKIKKERDEYWNEKFRAALLKSGLSEMVFKDSDRPRRTSDNQLIDKFYEATNNLKQKGRSFIEDSSIVKMNKEYKVPEYTMYKREKNNNGVYFNDLHMLTRNPEEMKEILKITALDVRAQGIEKPYIYTSAVLSYQDSINKKIYVEAQMRALLDHGEYSFDDIKVQKQHQDVYQKLLEEYADKRVSVFDMNKTIESLKNGTTSKIDKMILLKNLDSENFSNGHTQSEFLLQNNIVPEDYNLMLSKIKDNKGNITEKEANMLHVVMDYIETMGSSINLENNKKSDDIKMNINSEVQEISNNMIQFSTQETQLISNSKKIIDFNDYDGVQNSNERQFIKSLGQKVKNPEFENLISSLPENLIEAITKKSMLINLHEMHPEINPTIKKDFIKLISQNLSIENTFKVSSMIGDQKLEEIGNVIRQYKLEEIGNYLSTRIDHSALGTISFKNKEIQENNNYEFNGGYQEQEVPMHNTGYSIPELPAHFNEHEQSNFIEPEQTVKNPLESNGENDNDFERAKRRARPKPTISQ